MDHEKFCVGRKYEYDDPSKVSPKRYMWTLLLSFPSTVVKESKNEQTVRNDVKLVLLEQTQGWTRFTVAPQNHTLTFAYDILPTHHSRDFASAVCVPCDAVDASE